MVAHKLRFDTDCLHIISKDAPHVNSRPTLLLLFPHSEVTIKS
jgi:hypothetical protein